MLRISILYIDNVLFNSVYYGKSFNIPVCTVLNLFFLAIYCIFLFRSFHFILRFCCYVSQNDLLDDRLLWSRQCRQFANIRSLLLEKRDMLETGRAAEQHVGSG